MTSLMKILRNHRVNFKVVENRVISMGYVVNEDGKTELQNQDLTDYTKEEIYMWLGY